MSKRTFRNKEINSVSLRKKFQIVLLLSLNQHFTACAQIFRDFHGRSHETVKH